MVGEDGFPRRKRAGRARIVREPRTGPERIDDSAQDLTRRQSLDVARYVSEMAAQLEAMANAVRLDLLAYFLGMAKAESELFVRTNASDQNETGERESVTSPEVD